MNTKQPNRRQHTYQHPTSPWTEVFESWAEHDNATNMPRASRRDEQRGKCMTRFLSGSASYRR
jgi:hypothetical protein